MVWFPEKSIYPNFASIISHDLPLIQRSSAKMVALKKYSGLTDKELRKALRPSEWPRLDVLELPAFRSGEFDPRHPRNIAISKVLVEQYEEIFRQWHNSASFKHQNQDEYIRWQNTVSRAGLVFEAIILHELVHWGDYNVDGITKDIAATRLGYGDVGHMFVADAYGSEFKFQKLRIQTRVKEIRYVKHMEAQYIEGWLGWDDNKNAY